MDKFINNLDVVLFYYLMFLIPVIIGCIIEKLGEVRAANKCEKDFSHLRGKTAENMSKICLHICE